MKKKLALLLVAAMVAGLALAGCGKKDTGAGSNKADANTEKKEGDTFTVGFDAEFPPFGYKDDNGEYTGFDLELAQEVCDRNGWELVKQPVDWDSKDMELESGTIDCIWNGFSITPEREDAYTWSEPYINNGQIFLVTKDSEIKSFDDLAGKNVMVQADSSALGALEDGAKELADTFGNLTEIAEYNSAVMNLESGAADAVAIDAAIAAEYTTDGKVVELENGKSYSDEQYGIGFKLGNEKLRDQVQATYDEMLADGTVDKIAEKYADYQIAERIIK